MKSKTTCIIGSKLFHVLTFLSPYMAHKTLGHYKEPAGNQREPFRQLPQKCNKSTEFIWKCYLTPLKAWTYCYICYLHSIGYPLSCSSPTYAQLDRVQWTAITIIVARCGYNQNTKREIVYGPICTNSVFMRHWQQSTTIPGKLLKCAVAWTQMTAGTLYSIFQQVHDVLPHIESKWLTSTMRTFVSQINASLELDITGVPPIQ